MTVEAFVMQVLALGLGTGFGIALGVILVAPFVRKDRDLDR